MTQQRPVKRSVRNFLLNPGFQLKYSMLIALTGGLIFGVMAWLFFDKVRENTQLAVLDQMVAAQPAEGAQPKIVIQREAVVPRGEAPAARPPSGVSDEEMEQELLRRLEAQDTSTLWALAGFCMTLVVLLFFVGVLATHRIVGPIYVVDLILIKLLRGEPLRKRALRRGDEFQGLFQHVNELAGHLRDERRADANAIDDALRTLRARVGAVGGRAVTPEELSGWLDEDLAPLQRVADEKRDYLASSQTPPPG